MRESVQNKNKENISPAHDFVALILSSNTCEHQVKSLNRETQSRHSTGFLKARGLVLQIVDSVSGFGGGGDRRKLGRTMMLSKCVISPARCRVPPPCEYIKKRYVGTVVRSAPRYMVFGISYHRLQINTSKIWWGWATKRSRGENTSSFKARPKRKIFMVAFCTQYPSTLCCTSGAQPSSRKCEAEFHSVVEW